MNTLQQIYSHGDLKWVKRTFTWFLRYQTWYILSLTNERLPGVGWISVSALQNTDAELYSWAGLGSLRIHPGTGIHTKGSHWWAGNSGCTHFRDSTKWGWEVVAKWKKKRKEKKEKISKWNLRIFLQRFFISRIILCCPTTLMMSKAVRQNFLNPST